MPKKKKTEVGPIDQIRQWFKDETIRLEFREQKKNNYLVVTDDERMLSIRLDKPA